MPDDYLPESQTPLTQTAALLRRCPDLSCLTSILPSEGGCYSDPQPPCALSLPGSVRDGNTVPGGEVKSPKPPKSLQRLALLSCSYELDGLAPCESQLSGQQVFYLTRRHPNLTGAHAPSTFHGSWPILSLTDAPAKPAGCPTTRANLHVNIMSRNGQMSLRCRRTTGLGLPSCDTGWDLQVAWKG